MGVIWYCAHNSLMVTEEAMLRAPSVTRNLQGPITAKTLSSRLRANSDDLSFVIGKVMQNLEKVSMTLTKKLRFSALGSPETVSTWNTEQFRDERGTPRLSRCPFGALRNKQLKQELVKSLTCLWRPGQKSVLLMTLINFFEE